MIAPLVRTCRPDTGRIVSGLFRDALRGRREVRRGYGRDGRERDGFGCKRRRRLVLRRFLLTSDARFFPGDASLGRRACPDPRPPGRTLHAVVVQSRPSPRGGRPLPGCSSHRPGPSGKCVTRRDRQGGMFAGMTSRGQDSREGRSISLMS